MVQPIIVNERRDPFAVASFALGLSSFLCLAAPLALISGIVALIRIRNSDGELRGRTFAWFGIATSLTAITFYAMYFRAIPGLGWYHEMVMTRKVCGVSFQLGTPLANGGESRRAFNGDGYSATAYRIPSEILRSLQMNSTFTPHVTGFGNDWRSLGWKSPVEKSDWTYLDFALGSDAVRDLSAKSLAFPTTRVAYFYKLHTGVDGAVKITDVTIYLIDIENAVFIVADRNT
ncbi:hypothetical protein VN12_22715 [Pirellula sp. SH-Sr6A]|uniref:DUF4190 domain-containing protein n=1 Tax=Pirellula sp. SH-Sr6A TaxID=1632865 RepID=UPI00078C9379|nr:DUF4190 domain-containing protein [Pirellula sp. SH-Sr6A]AMV34957.1 hypothetical protein VN12_22715 [Pirellula sp. SH-Sr6A]